MPRSWSNEVVRFSLRMKRDLLEALQHESEQEGVELSQVIRKVLAKHVGDPKLASVNPRGSHAAEQPRNEMGQFS